MKSFIKNLTFLFLILVILFLVFDFSLAATVTLFGEVPDDGGDPYLEVWFQYGKTTSYGYETTHQKKYGAGEFSATVSGLEDCATYHYRAVAKHQNYNDIKYGEDKVFTTPCPTVSFPTPTVDLKANGRDGSITIPYNSSVTLSWTSTNSNYCVASGAWYGTKETSGSEVIPNLTSGPKTYILTCYGPGGSATDQVTIYLQQVLGAVSPSIQKKVRNLSDGQIQFSDSVMADPSEVLEFQIIINSGSGIQNVSIKEILPEKISIRPNSLKIDGMPYSGNIISGISLGNLGANQTKTIAFLADIATSSHFSFGQTTLTNTATLYWDGNSLSDSATIIIRKTGILGTATSAPTGIINEFVKYSPFLLVFSLVLIFVFKSHIIKWEEWLDEKKNKFQNFRAEILLRLKTVKIKLKTH
jgi:hypothetical protein